MMTTLSNPSRRVIIFKKFQIVHATSYKSVPAIFLVVTVRFFLQEYKVTPNVWV